MSRHRSTRLITLALVSASLLCAGCSRPGASPATSQVAVASTQAEYSATAPPSIEPSIEPSPMAEPPAASIAVEGGDPVVGQLGSFVWENGGSDAPWLPGSRIHVGSGERLMMTLAQPVALANWTASRVPSVGLDASGAVALGEGTGGPVTFVAPPPGTWSVHVSVWFADNLGSAAYFWLMAVD